MSDPKDKTQETPEESQAAVDPAMAGFAGSSNEPPGSQTQPPPEQREPGAKTEPVPDEREPLPSEAELSAMTRAELDELAEDRDLDPDEYPNKEAVIAALKKDARKRK